MKREVLNLLRPVCNGANVISHLIEPITNG